MGRTITVKGTGKISAQADEVILWMNLTARDEDYAAAARKAEEQAENLQTTLLKAGFPASELKTVDFNVNTEYENVRDEKGNFRNARKGFVCTRRLKVQFGFNGTRLAIALQALSDCDACPEISVSFTVKDRVALRDRALQVAVENALSRAKILCAASDVRLGQLLEIRHDQSDRPPFSPTRFAAADGRMFSASALAATVNPEDIEVEDSAAFTWEIE